MFCCLAKEKEAVIAPAILNAIKNQLEPDHAQLLNPLQQRNRTAFFVGAGASVESGLPNFRQFSEHLMASTLQQQHTSTSKESNGNIEVPVSDEDISMFASELRPEVLLQTLHDAFGYSIFDFYEWFDDAEPSTNHYILAKALREGGLILTTNVDTLIEEAYEELYGNQDFDLLVTSDEFEKYASSDLASIGSTNTNRNDSKGLLMKFHGTVDKSLTGLERYDTVRFLLDQVGEGCSKGVHQVLTKVCTEFDMIYLGYSGCDNFSVQPVMKHTSTECTSLWLWFEMNKKMVLENSSHVFEKEMERVGDLVMQGQSFTEIPRGMESLSTCEILTERSNALRLRGNISTIMHNADSESIMQRTGTSRDPPIPKWTQSISSLSAIRCAASLFSKANDFDRSIQLLEEARDKVNASKDETIESAFIQRDLATQYANSSIASGYQQALDCNERALEIFKKLDERSRVIEVQLNVINILRRMRRFDEAHDLINTLKQEFESSSDKSSDLKAKARLGLMEGLILGMGHHDSESKALALSILKDATDIADTGGFVSLQAATLNASGLVKYQSANESIEMLESGAKDLTSAFRLNIYIGDARACFQQMRNLGLIHVKLSRLLSNKSDLLEQAITNFRRGEKFLFRLSRQRVIGELLEIRFRLGETLVEAKKYEEAESILVVVHEQRVKLGDWHNEARTLELLLKASSCTQDLIARAVKIKNIYEDAKTNTERQSRFNAQPITVTNGKSILTFASDATKTTDAHLSQELMKLRDDFFRKI